MPRGVSTMPWTHTNRRRLSPKRQGRPPSISANDIPFNRNDEREHPPEARTINPDVPTSSCAHGATGTLSSTLPRSRGSPSRNHHLSNRLGNSPSVFAGRRPCLQSCSCGKHRALIPVRRKHCPPRVLPVTARSGAISSARPSPAQKLAASLPPSLGTEDHGGLVVMRASPTRCFPSRRGPHHGRIALLCRLSSRRPQRI